MKVLVVIALVRDRRWALVISFPSHISQGFTCPETHGQSARHPASCKPRNMLRQTIGKGFLSPSPVVKDTMSRTRIRRLSWQTGLVPSLTGRNKFRGLLSLLPSQFLPSSMQQIRSHSSKQLQEKAIKKHDNNENGHSVTKDELHTHSHSILGHSHSHGEDEHGHGHDPEQILAALKGSGV